MDNKHGKSNLKNYRKLQPPSASIPSIRIPKNPFIKTPIPASKVAQSSEADKLHSLEAPLIPTSLPAPPKDLLQPSTSSTNSRSNATQLPTASTVNLLTHGFQPPSSSIQSNFPFSQPIYPSLTLMQDQQSIILTHLGNSDRTLRDLLTEVGKLTEKAKRQEDETKEREAKDKAKEERESEHLKALILIAQRVDEIKKCVLGIETVVGITGGQDGSKKTVLDRLRNIEMDVEEWLEKVKDPLAGDRRGSIQPSTPSSLSPTVATVVQHGMAISPVRVSFTSQGSPLGSTSATEQRSTPKSIKVDVSMQVVTSDEPAAQSSIIQEVTESVSLCASCSKKLTSSYSSNKKPSPMSHSMDDNDANNSSASVLLPRKRTEGNQVERENSFKTIDDNSFLDHPMAESSSDANVISEPDFSPKPLSSVVPAPQTDLKTSIPESTYKCSDQKTKSPIESESVSPSPKFPIVSFSPIDWSKTHPLSASMENSSASAAVPSIVRSNSYTLPLQEGTLAASRNEALIDPYPYPSVSGLGDEIGSSSMVGIVGANIEATERVMSPENQFEGEFLDNPEPGTPAIVVDLDVAEREIDPIDTKRTMSRTLDAEKSAEDTPVHPKQMNNLLLLGPSETTLERNVSMLSESSLTSLTSNPSPPDSEKEGSVIHDRDPDLDRATSPQASLVIGTKQLATELPPDSTPPPSQTSEDEHNVMTSVMQALPSSPALAPPSSTAPSPLLSAALPLLLVTPEPNIIRRIDRDESPVNSENMIKLQEWYRKRLPDRQENIDVTTSSPQNLSATQSSACNNDEVLSNGDSNLQPPSSPLFTSASGHSPDVKAELDVLNSFGKMSVGANPPHSEIPRVSSPLYLKLVKEILKDDDDDVDIIPMRQSRTSSNVSSDKSVVGSKKDKIFRSPKPPRKSLLLVQKKGQPSKAMTRIRKRKVSQDLPQIEMGSEDEEDQPPLKRVKLRKKVPSSRNGKVASAVKPKSVSIVSPVKTPTKRLPRTASVVWPKIDNPVFDQFIECDTCDRWYHVGCVGVHPHDIRLSATEIYQCPPCSVGIPKEALTPVKKVQGNKEDADCSRPRCLCVRTQNIKTEDTFIIESFVGMFKKVVGGRGVKVLYLVKWLGYGFDEATWEDAAGMGITTPSYLIEIFEKEADNEGVDLSQCNCPVLLKCAVNAGWNSEGIFVKMEA